MYDKKKIYQSFDWIQGTILIDNVLDLFDVLYNVDCRLHKDSFVLSNSGLLGYANRYCHLGNFNIQICFNSTSDEDVLSQYPLDSRPFITRGYKEVLLNGKDNFSGVFISISGDGLRFLGDHQWDLYKALYSLGFKATRIDLALDFYNKDNIFIPFFQSAFSNEFYHKNNKKRGSSVIRTRMNLESLKPYPNVYPSTLDKNRPVIVNWQIGGGKSHLGKIKLYDKWLEVHTVPRLKGVCDDLCKDVPEKYWWRLEYSISFGKANYVFNEFMNTFIDKECNLAIVTKWCLDKFLDICVYKSDGYQLCQLELSDIWQQFYDYFNNISDEELNFNLAKLPYVPSARFFANNKRLEAYLVTVLLYCAAHPDYRQQILDNGLKKALVSPRYKELYQELNNTSSFQDFIQEKPWTTDEQLRFVDAIFN